MTCDVDCFSDEEEAGNIARLHRSGVEAGCVDAASSDFSLFEAFSAGGVKVPLVQVAFGSFKRGVGPALGSSHIGKLRSEALGKGRLKCEAESDVVAPSPKCEQGLQQVPG